jgi:hypothetical protein
MRGKVPLGITSVDGAKGMGGSGAESSGVEVDDDCGDAGSSPARFSSSVMRALSGRSGCCWIRFNILVVKSRDARGKLFFRRESYPTLPPQILILAGAAERCEGRAGFGSQKRSQTSEQESFLISVF